MGFFLTPNYDDVATCNWNPQVESKVDGNYNDSKWGSGITWGPIVYECAYTYIHTYLLTYIHTYILIYIYIHMCARFINYQYPRFERLNSALVFDVVILGWDSLAVFVCHTHPGIREYVALRDHRPTNSPTREVHVIFRHAKKHHPKFHFSRSEVLH